MTRERSATLIRERLRAQLLAGEPAANPVAAAGRLLAIQAQDPRGMRLAVRPRTAGLCASDVEAALSRGELVVSWLNRGTLHLVRQEDYHWLHALTTPPLSRTVARRLSQEEVEPNEAERALEAIERALVEEGPLSRDQLRERIAAGGVRTAGQALVYLLVLATLRLLIVRGPIVDGRHAYALARDWLGEPEPVDRERALAELARRYLAGHGPADERDLAKWSGLTLSDVRAGLGAIAPSLRERPDGLLDLWPRDPPAPLPPPRLLGAFDPLLLGWRSREPILGAHRGVVTVNGVFRPFALIQGRAVATWRLRDGRISIDPFGELSRDDSLALAADAEDVRRYLGAGSSECASGST
jgi:hypothetical protein